VSSSARVLIADKLTPAYEKVRSNNDELTWLLLDYEVSCWSPRNTGLPGSRMRIHKSAADLQSDKSNTLTLSDTGSGDLAEFTSKLQPQRASFGYVRVKYANDDHSFREKFCLVIWIGEEVKVMRRARVRCRRAER
jgi:hypothetical protein